MSEYKTMGQTYRDVTEESDDINEAPIVMDISGAARLILKYLDTDINSNRNNEKGQALLSNLAKLAGLNATFKGQGKGRVFVWDPAKRKKL
jgi:hypothetical protein